jgi:undecaprenyl-diphosphatase
MKNSKAAVAVAVAGLALFVTIAVWTHSGASAGFDRAVSRAVHPGKSTALPAIMNIVTYTASVVGSTAGGVFIIAALWRRTKRLQIIVHAAVALLVSTGGNSLIKLLFKRPRPSFYPWLTNAHGYSFPSGHTLAAVMISGFALWILHRPGRTARNGVLSAIFLLWVLAVAYSRVFLGVHYASDVAASAALGAFFLGGSYLTRPARQLDMYDVGGHTLN